MTEPTKPSLEELRTRARELDVSGRSGMDREALEAAVAAAEAGAGPADVAEAANATRGDVTARAEANSAGVTITAAPVGRSNTRAELDGESERAAKRSIYLDTNRRRRVLGAGQVVPPGWDFVEEASLAKRVAKAEESYGAEDKAERGPRD